MQIVKSNWKSSKPSDTIVFFLLLCKFSMVWLVKLKKWMGHCQQHSRLPDMDQDIRSVIFFLWRLIKILVMQKNRITLFSHVCILYLFYLVAIADAVVRCILNEKETKSNKPSLLFGVFIFWFWPSRETSLSSLAEEKIEIAKCFLLRITPVQKNDIQTTDDTRLVETNGINKHFEFCLSSQMN